MDHGAYGRVWTVPNMLTMFRILLVPVLLAVMRGNNHSYLLALGIFITAVLTDALDGYIARAYGLVTSLGKVLDPIADKLLVGTALVMLAMRGAAPLWMAAVIVFREAGMMILGFLVRRKGRYINVSALGKAKMVMESIAIALLFIAWGYPPVKTPGAIMLFIAMALAIASAVQYGVAYARKSSDMDTKRI